MMSSRRITRKQTVSALAALGCFVLGACLSARASAPQASTSRRNAAKSAFTQAQQSLAAGRLAAALSQVQSGLHLAPQSSEGLNLLGIILARQGRNAQALNAFETALKVNPRSVETHNNLGSFYASEGKAGLAEKEFRAALQLSPSDPAANYSLGAILLSRHDAQGALPYLRRVQPAGTATRLALVEAYLATHDQVKALSLARAISEESPKDLRLHFSLGVLLNSAQQYKQAVHELELADALKPGTFEILRQLGYAYLNDGDYAPADHVLAHALVLKPDSADALYLEAQTYADEKKTLQAFQLLFKARKLAPKDTDVIYLLARLSMNLAYYSDAIPLLEEGVKIDPKRPDLHAALGESYYSAGKIEDAYKQFRLLLQLDPSASSYAFMGLYYLHQGQFAEAQKYFNKGLQKHPGDAQCLYNLGYIADKQGDFAQGERLLEQALKTKPGYFDALYELASAKMGEKKFNAAIPLLWQCVKINPNKARAYYKLGVAERSLHEMDAAGRDFKVFETLARNPSSMPLPFQNFFESVSRKVSLSPRLQAEADLRGLSQAMKQNSDSPRNLYLLAETYLKLGQTPEAIEALARLRKLSGGDSRTMTGAGVLLARYKLFPDAIQYFQMALAADPGSDDAKYDLADAYFETRDYAHALQGLKQISAQGQNDPSTLALLGDTEAQLGDLRDAGPALRKVIQMSPDDDRRYLSLSLVQIRSGDLAGARQTLLDGQARIPDSGRIVWGMGVLAVMEGHDRQAESDFQHALDLMPEWESSYSALGTFYFDTGQVTKAEQTLDRYARLFPHGFLNVSALRRVLADASHEQPAGPVFLSPQAKSQFLGMAFALADINP